MATRTAQIIDMITDSKVVLLVENQRATGIVPKNLVNKLTIQDKVNAVQLKDSLYKIVLAHYLFEHQISFPEISF